MASNKQSGDNGKKDVIRLVPCLKGDISHTLGITRSFITNSENGRANPTLATIARIARALKVSVSDLVKSMP